MLFLYLCLTVVTLLGFNFILIIYNDRGMKLVRKLPRPKSYFIIGNGIELHVSPVELFQLGRDYAKAFKDGIYGWWALNLKAVNVFNPEDIERVISGMQHTQKGIAYGIMRPWLRDGLLLSYGSKWQHRRKILTPAFHFNILKRFFVTLEENSQRLVDHLATTQGMTIDIVPVISEYTLGCICETSMGTQLQAGVKNAGKIYKEAVYHVGKLCIDRLTKVYLVNDIFFNLSPLSRNTYKLLTTVRSFTERVIKDRKKLLEKYGNEFDGNSAVDTEVDDISMNGRKKKTAMLDLLLSAEKQGTIDSIGVQEEVDTFMFEGHDTTAAGLIYCLVLLANHKEVQDKIAMELYEIFGDSNRQATMDDISNMRYLERCLKESLRLYPPVPFISRQLSEDVRLSGYTIAAGTECSIHIYDLHRREDLYPNAEVFDPDRFLPENSVGRHPYAYIPFSAGPRNCIGQKFAMLELKSCLAAVLRRFEVLPVTTPADLKFVADLVLRSSTPVYVKFVERNTKVE